VAVMCTWKLIIIKVLINLAGMNIRIMFNIMTALPLSLPVSFNDTNGSGRKDLNVTIESSPKLGTDVVCVDQSVNLTCVTDQQVKDITWQWLDQSEEGSTISVQATQSEVVYTCKASYNSSQIGEANITVVANGEGLTLQSCVTRLPF